ncbi:MAG TPA: VOC family protein [Actinomycetota bacterium]|nr:VOC family protein [Actinomycetota bacterium]
MRVDHVVMAVRDLERSAASWARLGIATVPGGVHPRWGTANRIAPLGDAYLELLAVDDDDVASGTALGRAILERSDGGDRWFALCLADDDIDGTAARLGLTVEPGARSKPDGSQVRWRSVGIEDPRRAGDLPFFISWATPETHPGRTAVAHPAGHLEIASIDVAGDAEAFAAWTGGASLPVRWVEGSPGIRGVVLDAPRRAIEIQGAP